MRETIRPEREAAFWSYVDRSGECWLWTGGKAHNGYGIFRNGRWSPKAHRVAYVLAGNRLADSDVLRHICDTPACVRPDHLVPGTQRDNITDCWAKGRGAAKRRGEANECARLSDADVRAIRAGLARGERQVDLAARHGVSQTMVSKIKRGASRAEIR